MTAYIWATNMQKLKCPLLWEFIQFGLRKDKLFTFLMNGFHTLSALNQVKVNRDEIKKFCLFALKVWNLFFRTQNLFVLSETWFFCLTKRIPRCEKSKVELCRSRRTNRLILYKRYENLGQTKFRILRVDISTKFWIWKNNEYGELKIIFLCVPCPFCVYRCLHSVSS